MVDHDDKARANPGYALGQLARPALELFLAWATGKHWLLQ